MTIDIEFFGPHRCLLGESPLWDGARQILWWVDAAGLSIHAAQPDGETVCVWTYDRMVGSIGLAQGGLIAAFADHFAVIDETTGQAQPFAAVPGHDGSMRLNDGKVDRAGGAYLCGQTRMADAATGTMFQLSANAVLRPLASGIRISNAICFSPDGTRLYFADSLDGAIRCHDYDPASGAVGPQVAAIDLGPIGQAPDGATVDADGNIWVALVLDQAVACITPQGQLIRRIDVPMPYPSCPAFGGSALDTLFVTSISKSGHMLNSDHPDAGRIIAIRGLGVTGIAESRLRVPASKGGTHGL